MATRDAAATKARIAQAALKEFAAKGVAGARVDAIAARARTNKRMLYYYFGSKEGLFREILRQRLAAGQGSRAATEGRSYGERLAARQSLRPDLPDYIRLLMWEALETRSRQQPVMAEEERSLLYANLRDQVVAAQEAGELSADLDPGQQVLSELALTLFPAAFPQITRLVTGLSADDPVFIEERQRHLVRIAARLADRSTRT